MNDKVRSRIEGADHLSVPSECKDKVLSPDIHHALLQTLKKFPVFLELLADKKALPSNVYKLWSNDLATELQKSFNHNTSFETLLTQIQPDSLLHQTLLNSLQLLQQQSQLKNKEQSSEVSVERVEAFLGCLLVEEEFQLSKPELAKAIQNIKTENPNLDAESIAEIIEKQLKSSEEIPIPSREDFFTRSKENFDLPIPLDPQIQKSVWQDIQGDQLIKSIEPAQ